MKNFRTGMVALVTAAAVLGSQALAAELSLAPGKPAGIQQAARHSPNLLVMAGVGALVVGAIAYATSQGKNPPCGSACIPATTTTTS
jgi:hypothetical protein